MMRVRNPGLRQHNMVAESYPLWSVVKRLRMSKTTGYLLTSVLPVIDHQGFWVHGHPKQSLNFSSFPVANFVLVTKLWPMTCKQKWHRQWKISTNRRVRPFFHHPPLCWLERGSGSSNHLKPHNDGLREAMNGGALRLQKLELLTQRASSEPKREFNCLITHFSFWCCVACQLN